MVFFIHFPSCHVKWPMATDSQVPPWPPPRWKPHPPHLRLRRRRRRRRASSNLAWWRLGETPQGGKCWGIFFRAWENGLKFFFFWVGILAYVQFLSLALGWYMKLVHLVLGESFFMDFRDGWISFISNNRGANPKWDTMESHWNSFCSVVSFCFPYALRWFQVMSLAWAKSPATDP